MDVQIVHIYTTSTQSLCSESTVWAYRSRCVGELKVNVLSIDRNKAFYLTLHILFNKKPFGCRLHLGACFTFGCVQRTRPIGIVRFNNWNWILTITRQRWCNWILSPRSPPDCIQGWYKASERRSPRVRMLGYWCGKQPSMFREQYSEMYLYSCFHA